MPAIPDTGRLEEYSLPRLLMDLYRARFNGSVELGRQRVEHEFLFSAGVPISCKSVANKTDLCDQLVAAGTLKPKDRDRANSLIERKGCKEASALLELGLLDPRALMLALRDQTRIRLLECIGWSKGAFTREASAKPPEAPNPFRVDLFAVVQAGIETHWRADRVLLDLEPKIARYAAKTDQFDLILERLEPDDALASFVQAVDAENTLWGALKLATTPRSLAAAWVLDAAGGLDYQSESEAADRERSPRLEIVFTDSPATRLQKAAPDAGVSRSVSKPPESDAAAALRREIASRFEKLGGLDHYQLLGLVRAAKAADIKHAYREAAKTYHPDALSTAGLDLDTRQKASNVFARISKAHAVLSNPRRRAEYDAAKNSREGPIDAERLANAETLYRKGDVLLRAGNFSGAIEFLRPAVDLWPDESDYCSALGWALFRKRPSEPALAREQLERAVELSPDNPIAIHRLSVVVRSLGETDEADGLLKRARAIDPKIV